MEMKECEKIYVNFSLRIIISRKNFYDEQEQNTHFFHVPLKRG